MRRPAPDLCFNLSEIDIINSRSKFPLENSESACRTGTPFDSVIEYIDSELCSTINYSGGSSALKANHKNMQQHEFEPPGIRCEEFKARNRNGSARTSAISRRFSGTNDKEQSPQNGGIEHFMKTIEKSRKDGGLIQEHGWANNKMSSVKLNHHFVSQV